MLGNKKIVGKILTRWLRAIGCGYGILSSFLTDTSLAWDTKWDDGIESLIDMRLRFKYLNTEI